MSAVFGVSGVLVEDEKLNRKVLKGTRVLFYIHYYNNFLHKADNKHK
ncbi:hypothetical protein VRK_07810 [Vibrio sp. MEBiC08052]|nr:hypothetical protein VRK_07810 [Vibrio sp. MEBiC08052]